MKIPEGLFELLKEHELPTQGFEIHTKIKDTCCDNKKLEQLPRREGFFCYNCGIVTNEPILDNGFEEKGYERKQTYGAPVGSDTHYVLKQRRCYKPITHFKEHLRRYVGFRFTDISLKTNKEYESINEVANMITVDVMDKDAYFKVKKELKAMKLSNLYKEIFCIIYYKGGVRPNVSYQAFTECIKDYENLVFHFFRNQDKIKRHSMPSVYMMLEILLKKHGHVPYYNLPTLKDKQLRLKVMEIYQQILDWRDSYDAFTVGKDETDV